MSKAGSVEKCRALRVENAESRGYLKSGVPRKSGI